MATWPWAPTEKQSTALMLEILLTITIVQTAPYHIYFLFIYWTKCCVWYVSNSDTGILLHQKIVINTSWNVSIRCSSSCSGLLPVKPGCYSGSLTKENDKHQEPSTGIQTISTSPCACKDVYRQAGSPHNKGNKKKKKKICFQKNVLYNKKPRRCENVLSTHSTPPSRCLSPTIDTWMNVFLVWLTDGQGHIPLKFLLLALQVLMSNHYSIQSLH